MTRKTLTYILTTGVLLLAACSKTLSEEEAKQVALTHASLIEADVTFIKCNLEKDDLREYYDVEFYVEDQQEYDYEIDAKSGEILEWDVEPIYNIAH